MKISVCIPVMRRPRMLERALYSIRMQDFPDVEIVIKDGDPDNPMGASIYKALWESGFTINYAVGRDGGIFPAVNDCLKRATGDILYFMCSDDLLCPGAFQTVNEAFSSDRFGGAMWAYGQTISADHLGRTLGIDGEPPDPKKMRKNNCIGQPSTFWNRQMMELAGVFDLRYKHAGDYDLWLRFWKRRDPVYINNTLGIFCHHENQNTAINNEATCEEARKIAQRHSLFGPIMERARNMFIQQKAYGKEAPLASDDR